ncbi:hypothetical protein PDE_07159 [Penicillium oxalicum 114-2]|uniref:Uncharacterized protein n=1 Tax=Penicillium oxalicum (strain 114-2 / CGMCC 5302) TaxID=933388 RepID=S7ZP90_PENO1|nr:hypothetical protein PDE_07159 [Penicillium oxalicum 114-2]
MKSHATRDAFRELLPDVRFKMYRAHPLLSIPQFAHNLLSPYTIALPLPLVFPLSLTSLLERKKMKYWSGDEVGARSYLGLGGSDTLFEETSSWL